MNSSPDLTAQFVNNRLKGWGLGV